ncbi:glycosyltransferase [Ectothiorhodospira mobilis]|uniref:glycosyltransferase n=1 Tax=Ectothiorhodospira mobilis TaxID=195064 RepID=UPI001EE79810|nr:glycosyltransferase [Ectothiorhodospira mobilis]MCG5534668.1 glycosyltransferase [Ectothiorhodospira mobilis]
MRIVIDLQACQSASRLGGIGRYTQSLVEALARNRGHHELRILLSDRLPEAIQPLYERLAGLLPRHHIQVFQAPGPVSEGNPAHGPRARAAELVRERLIRGLRPDILHIGSVVEGLGDDVITSIGRLMPGRRTSATLYDLIPLVESDTYLADPVVAAHYHRKLEELQRAGLLLAISEYSRREGIQHLGLDPERVVNIAAGVDPRFQPRPVPDQRAAPLRARYGIRGDFILYTSSFDRRKNHPRLIQAYARLPQALRARCQLVIAGNGNDAIYAPLRRVARQAGLAADQVIFTGRVDDEDLLDLYNLCRLFVFPSLREGYGLPVLEAMACGAPCIASATTSLPEVLGREDALFEPHDPDSIAARMRQVLEDDTFARNLAEHGRQRAARFTWDASARAALDAFEAHHARTAPLPEEDDAQRGALLALSDLVQRQPALQGEIPRIAAALEANERILAEPDPRPRRIGWVTPWNTRCGIATYARHLAAPHLRDYTFLAPVEEQPEQPDEANVLRCWHPGDPDLRELARRVHEQGLDTLLIQFNYGLFDFPALAAFLREMIATGRRLFTTLHATRDTPTRRLETLAPALRLFDAVFVHSPRDREALARLGISANVEVFPHGVPDTAPADVDPGIPPGRFVVACYGFFLPHKGFPEIIEACHQRLQAGDDLHLLLVTARYPVDLSAELIQRARQRIRELGMEDRVTLVDDFLEDAHSLGHLRHAHLIVYPYQETGESASGAVRMGLVADRPVAVTPLAIFDDVRDCTHRLPGTGPDALARGIACLRRELLQGDDPLREAARAWVETHRYPVLSERLWRRLNA